MRFAATFMFASLLAGPAFAGAAEELHYRLAGVFGSDEVKFALIETPDGRHRRLKVGGRLDNGQVLEITATTAVIQLDSGETLELALDGGDASLLMPADQMVQVDTTVTWFADPDTLRRNLTQARADTPPGAPVDSAAALKKALRLPPKARVLAVDDQPVFTAVQLARAVEEAFEIGGGVMLSITGVRGVEKLYVSPHATQAAQPAPVPQ